MTTAKVPNPDNINRFSNNTACNSLNPRPAELVPGTEVSPGAAGFETAETPSLWLLCPFCLVIDNFYPVYSSSTHFNDRVQMCKKCAIEIKAAFLFQKRGFYVFF
jgi:hypothetical protein